MAMRSVLNRLPPALRKRAYGLTSGGAAFKARRARARGLATNAEISPLQTKLAVGAGALTLGCVAGQTFFGSAEDFYDHRFVTEADPNALAEFYGNEDFMEIFCVFPFMVDFMMRSGYFDDNGHVHTFGLPPVISNMVVSMQFDEREEDDGNGETNTICFNKKERFKCSDSLFGNTLWEMVQNFGYATREDGKIEVYHYGQKWQGPFFIRLVFQMHARYVIYATEQHVNSPRFLAQDEDEDEEDDLVAQRHNIPKHLLGQFLDGLDVDVQAKLKESVEALQVARTSEEEAEVKQLLGTVRRLEGLVADLKSAKLKRAKTVSLPLQRRVTEGGPAPKLEGSARGFYQRALVRRATAVEEDIEDDDDMSQADGLAGTIAAALQHVESVAEEPGAIIRRLTAIEEVEAEELVVRNAIVRRLTAIEEANEEEEVAAPLRRSERSHGEVSPVLKRYSTLKRLYTSVVNNVNDDELALEFAEAGAELAATPVAPEVVEAAPEVVARTTTPVVSEIVSRVTAPVAVEAVVRTTTPVAPVATVAAEAREVVVEAAALEPESSVAALVRRVTAKIAEAVEARMEASPMESAAEAPVRHQTQLSLNFPGGYGYGYPPAPYAYPPQMPPQQYAQQPQMPPQQYAQQQYAQRPQGPPCPYYYAPPPPPGYWAPPGHQHLMMVPQGAYYPGAAVSTSSSASQTE